MIVTIVCFAHGSRAVPVLPAGEQLHWLTVEDGVYELDEADLYCTRDGQPHDFVITVKGMGRVPNE